RDLFFPSFWRKRSSLPKEDHETRVDKQTLDHICFDYRLRIKHTNRKNPDGSAAVSLSRVCFSHTSGGLPLVEIMLVWDGFAQVKKTCFFIIYTKKPWCEV